MKVTHVLGHNSNWNTEAYFEQQIGEYFLITAFSHGIDFGLRKDFQKVHDISMIDLQFYGKKNKKGKLDEFPFHTANCDEKSVTNVYFESCVKQSIQFQKERGFKNIIIPHFYENEEVNDIIDTIKKFQSICIKYKKSDEEKYFMTLPFANHIIIDKDKVEEILFESTDRNCFIRWLLHCL